jgi:acyl-CoA dehydrogenase
MNAMFSLTVLIGGMLVFAVAAVLKWIKRGLIVAGLGLAAVFGLVLGLVWRLLVWVAQASGLRLLRRYVVTAPVFSLFRRVLPSISDTERVALDAGGVWWERELFSGHPDWSKLHAMAPPVLTPEEQAFLDGPCDELCRRLDEWKITHAWADLPPEIWDFLRTKGFFAMIIPKRYGGLEFSNFAHSQVLLKIASRSPTTAPIVAVPNSLGPAELLLHYGTDTQRDYYLPRLADGSEVPCFALTSPTAGSDATSIRDTGVVCKGSWQGKEVVGIRLNWDKRYITLAPVATLLGLAFKLYDPEHLLGEQDAYGITCALVPTYLPGITIGRRHFPLNVPFQNGPTQGQDVFIPVDHIIGGVRMAGHGWRMLVENLSVGRSISLPTIATGASKLALYATGAYMRIRKQFRVPIAAFEGVQEVLARMGSTIYVMDATRRMTLAALDQGERPAVASAIVKYHLTEMGRQIANDAMDVHGGKGIMLGPGNYLASGWRSVPIAITVEGANIMTRCLMIFGQGAIRAHPYILEEMEAAHAVDRARGLKVFDRVFFRHVGFLLSNAARSVLAAVSGGRGLRGIPQDSALAHRYRQLARFSAAFALVSDATMLSLGGALKRRERLSARLGDVLSDLYMGSAVLKRYAEDGEPAAERIVVEYALDELTYRMEDRLNEVLLNLPNRALARLLTMLVLPLGRHARLPSDEETVAVANLFSTSSAVRTRLCADIFATDSEHVISWLDEAMKLAEWAEPVERRIAHAQREGRLETESGADEAAAIRSAVSAGLVTDEEAQRLTHYHELVARIVAVDDFDSGELGADLPVDNENDRVNAWRDSERRSFSAAQSERKR